MPIKQIVFIFYETAHPNLTTDHLVYHKNAFETTYNLWKTNKTGFLSTFPFGAFAYARLDDRLANEPLWKEYQNTSKDKQVGNEKRDPMYLLPSKQPNIELFTTECYGGPKQYDHFPASPNRDANVFSIIAELFSPHSRGSVTLSSRDGRENPVVDCNYLDHPLDMLVLSEGVRFANEIVMNGAGTKGIVKGSWPEGLGYGTPGKERFRTREDWVPYVKEHATTCEFTFIPGLSRTNMLTVKVTTLLALALWERMIILWQYWITSCACVGLQICVWQIAVSCLLSTGDTRRCRLTVLVRNAQT